jgi:hypothetical protein
VSRMASGRIGPIDDSDGRILKASSPRLTARIRRDRSRDASLRAGRR